jgi:hypothetical protein
MKIELLEEKTIITLDHQRLQQSEVCPLYPAADITENSSEKHEDSLGTTDNFEISTFLPLKTLSRKYLTKKTLLNPRNFFSLCQEPIEAYVCDPIKEIESYLCKIPNPVSPEVYKLSHNEIYQGHFTRYLRKDGMGVQVLAEEKYTGHFVRGQRHGYGRLIKATGKTYYEGNFNCGKLQGEGMCVEDGIKFTGLFVNGLKSGKGKEEWPDKTVYIGDYCNNLKHGYGKFIWGNGNLFEGQLKNGDISGTGVFQWKNGKLYSGQWKKNKMHGFGEFKWPDGKVYQGFYKKDLKHGTGRLVWPDGREYEGEWKKGLQHGLGYYKWYNKLKEKQEQRKGEWSEGNRINWINESSNALVPNV